MISLLPLESIEAQDTLYDTYRGELGIEIKSYSANWKGEKLESIYRELLNNTYGEEITYLSTINLYPDNPYGGEEEGLYHGAYQSNSLFSHLNYSMKKDREIDLFNMKEKNNIEDVARTLSHEYGHHFTLYHLIEGENQTFEQWQDTNYAKVRGLLGDERVRSDYENGHQWNITEIVAEDYVQLFGSPNAKKPKYYDDILRRSQKGTLDQVLRWNNHIFNVYPQENFHIPLANDVPHLRQYWVELSEIILDKKKILPTSPTLGLTQVEDIGYNKKQFIFQWTESEHEDSTGLLYTLVAFDKDKQQVIPIKTVKQGGELSAVVGSAKVTGKNQIVFYSDTFIDSSKGIRVFAMDKQGNIVSSNILNIDFNNPTLTSLQDIEYMQEELKNQEKKNHKEVFYQEDEKRGWLDRGITSIIHFLKIFIEGV